MFTLSFPGHKSAEPITGLEDENDVYEAIKSEVRQSIENMGSDGYDLIWPDGAPEGVKIADWLDEFDESESERLTMEAHERGIEHQVTLWTPTIHKKLWIRYMSLIGGEVDIAVDNTTYATLPDGIKLALKEETDD